MITGRTLALTSVDWGAPMDNARLCHGGPMNDQLVVSRFPAGFIAVDRPLGKAWLYDLVEDGYQVREEQGRSLDLDKRLVAAFGPEWDVIAVPNIGLTADLVDADEDDGIPEGES